MEQTFQIEIIQPSDLENLSGHDNVIELTDVGIIGLDSLCRLCANRSDHLIPIYEGEGLDYQLEMKINRHFPFIVERNDALPTHCCYQCASTLLTWHELIEASVEADRRLKNLEFDAVVQFNHKLENLDESSQNEVGSEQANQTQIFEENEDNENSLRIATPTVDQQQRSNPAVLVSFTSYHNAQKSLLFHQSTDEASSVSRVKLEEHQEEESGEALDDDIDLGGDADGVDSLPLSERVNNKKYRCETCNETFKTLKYFKNHLAVTLHKARRGRVPIAMRYYCDICDNGFNSSQTMVKHRKVHDDKPDDPPSPSIPKDEAPPQDTLALAVSVIKTELSEYPDNGNNRKEICRVCNSAFELKQDLKRHVRLRHPETVLQRIKRRKKSEITPNFYCDVCVKGFTRKYDMQKHRKQTHPDVPEKDNLKKTKSQQNAELLARCKIEYEGRPHYKCEHCSRIIHLSYNFLRHQTIHTGVRAFFCHLCGKSFRMSSGLNRHIKELHYGVKNYPCDMCGRCFASKNTRDDHMNIHTGARPFVCDQCGKCFKQKASLHVHKIFHTNEKPYVCGTCGKQFRRATELKVHGWLHTGHKPHACSTCGSTFRLAQDLKRHQKTHSKDFQVACEECGACFGQARYLKSHLKTHRKKEAVALSNVGGASESTDMSILPDITVGPEFTVNS